MAIKKSKNPLPSSYRGKKRYLVVQFESTRNLTESQISTDLQSLITQLYGSVGSSKIKPHLIFFDSIQNTSIIRCSLESLEELKAAIILWSSINGQPIRPTIRYVSGSLAKIKAKFKLAAPDD